MCGHTCCSLRSFCIIAKLQEVKSKVYVPSRGADQFKMKVVEGEGENRQQTASGRQSACPRCLPHHS